MELRVTKAVLEDCLGFRVDGPDGRVGTVERLLDGADQTDELAVRTGLFCRRLLIVPANTVAEITPSRRRVLLGRPPALVETERSEASE
jgi:hypothetical protein